MITVLYMISSLLSLQGHALAGGCVVGLACDYRVMADGFQIGMIEIEAVSYVK